MLHVAEPTISMPETTRPTSVPAPTAPTARASRRKLVRYTPERGLIRRLRTAQANDDIDALALHHKLDAETRKSLSAELIKAGAPPVTPSVAEDALARLVRFEPLNADALRPFMLLSADRTLRAHSMALLGHAMRDAGRSVKLVSDAIDARENTVLVDAGKRLGCGVTRFDGSPECVDILRKTDLACLSILEAGFRAPLDRVALLRLNTLIKATGAEPVFVMRPEDASLAQDLSKIGLKRVILATTGGRVSVGPVLTVLRTADLSIAEFLETDDGAPVMRPGQASALAEILIRT